MPESFEHDELMKEMTLLLERLNIKTKEKQFDPQACYGLLKIAVKLKFKSQTAEVLMAAEQVVSSVENLIEIIDPQKVWGDDLPVDMGILTTKLAFDIVKWEISTVDLNSLIKADDHDQNK